MVQASYDVCVIGGGPAGLSAAYTLASVGLKTLLVLEQETRSANAGETLHPSAFDCIRQLQLEDAFKQLGLETLSGFESSWGNPHPVFKPAIQMSSGAGWLFRRTAFEQLLIAQFIAKGGQVRYGPYSLTKDSHWQLTIESSNENYKAAFLVIATGRKGWNHFSLGPKKVWDKLISLSILVLTADKDRTVRVDALESGWLYTAKHEQGIRVVSLFTDGDLFKTRDSAAITGHIQQLLPLAPSVRKTMLSLEASTDVKISSANTTKLEKAIGPGWLACGDCAQTYDPLSSQGIVHALRSGLEAGQYLREHFEGAKYALSYYELSRLNRFQDYLNHRQAYYQLEQRWPNSEFWSRRAETKNN